ncbi:MAG: hypothetical protein ABI688_08355 [Bacteroidota bacterium]
MSFFIVWIGCSLYFALKFWAIYKHDFKGKAIPASIMSIAWCFLSGVRPSLQMKNRYVLSLMNKLLDSIE